MGTLAFITGATVSSRATSEVVSRSHHKGYQDQDHQCYRYRAAPAQTQQGDDGPDHDAGNDRIRNREAQGGRTQGGQIAKHLELVGEADQEPANEAPQEAARPGAAASAGGIAEDGARAAGEEGRDHARQRDGPANQGQHDHGHDLADRPGDQADDQGVRGEGVDHRAVQGRVWHPG